MLLHRRKTFAVPSDVKKWMRETFVRNGIGMLEKDQVYGRYLEFCEERDIQPKEKQIFSKLLFTLYPEVKSTRLGPIGRQTHYYLGLCWRDVEGLIPTSSTLNLRGCKQEKNLPIKKESGVVRRTRRRRKRKRNAEEEEEEEEEENEEDDSDSDYQVERRPRKKHEIKEEPQEKNEENRERTKKGTRQRGNIKKEKEEEEENAEEEEIGIVDEVSFAAKEKIILPGARNHYNNHNTHNIYNGCNMYNNHNINNTYNMYNNRNNLSFDMKEELVMIHWILMQQEGLLSNQPEFIRYVNVFVYEFLPYQRMRWQHHSVRCCRSHGDCLALRLCCVLYCGACVEGNEEVAQEALKMCSLLSGSASGCFNHQVSLTYIGAAKLLLRNTLNTPTPQLQQHPQQPQHPQPSPRELGEPQQPQHPQQPQQPPSDGERKEDLLDSMS